MWGSSFRIPFSSIMSSSLEKEPPCSKSREESWAKKNGSSLICVVGKSKEDKPLVQDISQAVQRIPVERRSLVSMIQIQEKLQILLNIPNLNIDREQIGLLFNVKSPQWPNHIQTQEYFISLCEIFPRSIKKMWRQFSKRSIFSTKDWRRGFFHWFVTLYYNFTSTIRLIFLSKSMISNDKKIYNECMLCKARNSNHAYKQSRNEYISMLFYLLLHKVLSIPFQ